MNGALEFLLLWLVLQAAVTDLAMRRIPNVLILGGLFIALGLLCRTGGPGAWLDTWLAGCATGFFLFLPLYAMRGMAAGDVKLMAMAGAFTGPAGAVRIALLACLIGGLLALAMLVLNGRWRILLRNLATLVRPLAWRLAGASMAPASLAREASAGGMPYGVAIASATVLVRLQAHGFL